MRFTKIKYFSFFLVFCAASILHAQDQVLMTIDGDPVYADEFKQVYLKNIDLVEDQEQRDLSAYLELFKNYKLKLKQAYDMGLDKREDLTQELDGYKVQLAQNYMTDGPVTEALVKEAYDHSVDEVRASHIMISLQNALTKEDTLQALEKIKAIREKAIAGAHFEALAKQESEDPSAANNGGDLGWFNAFKMVYPFEVAAYNTPVGEISDVVKTRFGYHILKVTDRRKSQGEVEVAHIMVVFDQKDESIDPETRINEIYQKLMQGESFETLAGRYSDDSKTAKVGGNLGRFGAGALNSPKFEEVAFSLKEPDEISKPFKSEQGWHIIKLIEKYPVSSLAEMRSYLESKVKNDSRSQLASEALVSKLKNRYKVTQNPNFITDFQKLKTQFLESKNWQAALSPEERSKEAVKVEDAVYTYGNFADYLQRWANVKQDWESEDAITQLYKGFENIVLKEYYQSHLEDANPEYAKVVKEYEEGVLIFALMEEKIWNTAKNDTTGLSAFYKEHKDQYTWPKRYDVIVASSPDLDKASEARGLLKKGLSTEEIKKTINKGGKVNIFITHKKVALEDKLLPEEYMPVSGVSKIYKEGDYSVVVLKEIIPESTQTLNEIKGKVINDYQQELEKKWMDDLAATHDIEVNEKVFNKIKQELSR